MKYKKVHTIVGFIGSGDCEDADEVFYAPTDVMLFGLAGAMVSGGLLASPTVRTYTYLFYKKRS